MSTSAQKLNLIIEESKILLSSLKKKYQTLWKVPPAPLASRC